MQRDDLFPPAFGLRTIRGRDHADAGELRQFRNSFHRLGRSPNCSSEVLCCMAAHTNTTVRVSDTSKGVKIQVVDVVSRFGIASGTNG